MSFEEANTENLTFMLNDLADHLKVANRALFDAEDYDLDKYTELKSLHEVVVGKEKLSPMETQAFVDELASIRKK
jgi:uncharacterized protein YfkK (UPF0435 family)